MVPGTGAAAAAAPACAGGARHAAGPRHVAAGAVRLQSRQRRRPCRQLAEAGEMSGFSTKLASLDDYGGRLPAKARCDRLRLLQRRGARQRGGVRQLAGEGRRMRSTACATACSAAATRTGLRPTRPCRATSTRSSPRPVPATCLCARRGRCRAGISKGSSRTGGTASGCRQGVRHRRPGSIAAAQRRAALCDGAGPVVGEQGDR